MLSEEFKQLRDDKNLRKKDAVFWVRRELKGGKKQLQWEDIQKNKNINKKLQEEN